MTEIRCPGASCPYCGRVNDASTGVEGGTPVAGDVSICLYCSLPGIFTAELLIRKPTAEEQVELDDSAEVQRVRGAILRANLRR